MLFGTAAFDDVAAYAPEVDIDKSFALDAGRVEWAQFIYELAGDRQNYDILPPGVNPTTPIVAKVQLWRARGGALGDFGLAQLRLTCRAGMRIRGYLLQSVIDGGEAARVLTQRFGYGPTQGTVAIHARADVIEGEVIVDGRVVFSASLLEPVSVEPSSIQHVANMNPARANGGLTLLQVDPEFTQASLRRGAQRLKSVDSSFWRLQNRTLKYPVIGVAGEAAVRIPPVAYTTEPFPAKAKPA